jgi:hypothetical protein
MGYGILKFEIKKTVSRKAAKAQKNQYKGLKNIV